MSRRLRSPEAGLNLRAEDFSNMLFVLPIMLLGRLPSKHVRAAAWFVDVLSRLAQTALDQNDFVQLEKSAKDFLTYFYDEFYRRSESRMNVCTYVVHRFGDAPGLLRLHGPGWTTWSFFVETFGGWIANSVKSFSNPEANIAHSVQVVRRLSATIPFLEDRIRITQNRRVRLHSSRAKYRRMISKDDEDQLSDVSDEASAISSPADENDPDFTGGLKVCLGTLVQLGESAFRALVEYIYPDISSSAALQNYTRSLETDPVGKYVSTFRKLSIGGYLYVGKDETKANRRHRCYALAAIGEPGGTVVMIRCFFRHLFKGVSQDLFLFQHACNVVHNPEANELCFKTWSSCRVAPIYAIQRPAAVVCRKQSTVSQSETFFVLSRVEMLARMQFN